LIVDEIWGGVECWPSNEIGLGSDCLFGKVLFFQRDKSVEASVLGLVDDAHTATAKLSTLQ
jgi:hypothetical protein